MNKSELIDRATEISGLSKSDTRRALESTIKIISRTLQDGDSIVIRGVGSFRTGNRAARTGRNPQTGKEIKIPLRRVVRFKANCPGPH